VSEDFLSDASASSANADRRDYPQLISSAHFAALDASPLPTTFVAPDLVYRFVNRSYERWFGLQWGEVVGRTLQQVIGKAAAEAVMPFAEAALKGGTVQFESTLPYPNRGSRRMKIVYSGVRAADGNAAGFFAYLEDVTALHDAEAAVTAALDGIGDGYFTVDRQMRFTFVNQAAAELYRVTSADLVGRHIDAVFAGASRGPTGRLLREVLETRKPQRRVLPSAGIEGRTFTWDVVPLLTGGAAVVMHDANR
jgi:PAS domain S-box-containing protein